MRAINPRLREPLVLAIGIEVATGLWRRQSTSLAASHNSAKVPSTSSRAQKKA